MPVVRPEVPALDIALCGEFNSSALIDWNATSAPVHNDLRAHAQEVGELADPTGRFDCVRNIHAARLHGRFRKVNKKFHPLAKLNRMSDAIYRAIGRRLDDMHRSWAWLARELGATDQAVNNWSRRGVPRGRLVDIGRLIGVSAESLAGYALPLEGAEARVNPPNYPQQLEYAGRPKSSSRVPVVGTAKLGEDGYYYELEAPAGHGDGYVEAYSGDQNAYAVRVKGDSMHPAIKHGQYAVIEPGGQLVPGENVLIALRDGRKMIKELVTGRDDSLTVVSVNGGERLTFDREEIEYIHAVAGVISASKWRPE